MTKLSVAFLMSLLFLAPLPLAHPHAVNGEENHSMVDILDPELRKIVAGRLAKAPTDPITADDMKTLTNVFTGGNGPDIRHLEGLEHAVNLTSLQLLRPPPRTQAELNARPFWRTDDLAPLTKLTKLEHLTIQGSVVFDMTPIANLTNLGDLAFNYTYGISQIPDLSKLTELVHLRLEHNRITDISGVSGLTNLRQLRLGSNRNLSDITPLTQLSNLEILRLDNTLVTHESLSAVLPFMSTEIDQVPVDEYPPTSITSGEFGISGTNISDLSVLDSLPDVFLWGLYLRFLGSIPDRTFPFHLKDLTPLVDLMNKGKVINGKTSIYLLHNYGLDYESLYEDIPALLADTTGRTVSHPKVEYAQPKPMLEREFPTAASYTGVSRTQYTFKVRAININPDFPAGWVPLTPHGTGHNRQFAKVPVTWKVTAPDGTVTEQKVLTGDDGVSSFPLTLGDDGETHTVEAIVPAKTTSGLPVPLNPNYPNPNTALSHEELKVTFTAEAVSPLAITLTLDNATYTDIQWIADVSGRPLPGSYAYYYKKSADREWIKVTHLEHRARRFSFIHSELQPGTSYDFQLVGLRGEDRIESNVLTARTLSRTPPRPPPPEPPPEPPAPANNPPVFTSAATVSVQENTTAVIRIVAEDPDTGDEITGYAITGGADRAMLEIGGTGTPSDMLHFKAAPDFENPQDADTDNVCILILTATSGTGDRELTATQTLTITVTDVDETPPEPPNNPPVFTSASAVSVQENTTAVITVVAEDPDAEDEITGYAITGGADQALFELSGTGTPSDMLRFKTAPDFEMPGSAANSNVYTLILTATSGVSDRELTATQTLIVTVTDVDETPPAPVNRPPVFRSASTVNVAENTTAVVTIVAEDPDAEDEITSYAITGGADQALFEIGGASTPLDLLRFKTAPDFETPQDADKDNVYIVILTATSGVGARELTATQTLTITVTVDERPSAPVNRPPVFTSASTVNVAENTTAVITVVAEDPDAEDEITSYAITGGADAALFELGGTSSPLDMLRFKAAPDFEMPGSAANSNVYTVILTATGGTGDRELTATQTLTITVTDVDETPPPPPVNRPPVFTSASAVNVAENTTAVLTVVAEDPDVEDEITGYAITGGADRAFFEIHGTNTPSDLLRFKAAPDFEMPEDADKNNVYILILTATSGVGDRELTATQTLTVTVTDVDETPPPPPQPVNRPPVFTSAATVNVAENTTAVITVVAEDPDAEDEITNYAITGGVDAALFELGGTDTPPDMLRFKAAPDFEMPRDADTNNVYTLILTATSGVSARELTATQTLTVTVTDVDEPIEPPVEPPVEPPAAGSGPGAPSPIPIGIQSFIFSEIGNFSDDRNDWIELTNVCNTPLDLSEWQVRLIRTDAVELGGQIETDVISFCDFLLPPQAVLLVASTDPSVTRLASGFNIATGARSRGAQHPYFVAPDLRLPSTPFLLILQRVLPGTGNTRPTLMDVAGSLFLEVLPDGSEVYFDPDTPNLPAATAPLTEVGVYERQHLEYPGYLASAWGVSGYRGGIGYDRHVAVSVALGTPGYRRDPSPSQPVVSRLVFNEIRNASNDTNDWIELKNVCGSGVRLKDWRISIVLDTGQLVDEEVGIVSFPDYTVPMGGVLLITNRDPSETVLADGLNIATGRRSRGAQHPYLVAPGLRLTETPYLLILEEVREYGERRIEDVAGNYALTTLPDGTEVHPHLNVSRSTAPLAPLTHFGAWQRRHLEGPGYLASAWMSSGYHGGIGYDRYVPASLCLGTPGYRHDPSPVLPETQRLAFNKIHNAGDDADNYIDYIELKNISDTGVRLKHWAISSVASAGEKADEDVDIVSFPDWTLPVGGVLLVLNTEPGPVIFNGRNIAMDAEPTDTEQTDTQQTEAQRDYFVAPDLQLPQTPYLLILRHARGKNGTPEAIEDVAGDYFRTHDNTQVWPLADTLRPGAPAVPLSEAGTYQRTDARQRGYLATAWTAIASPLHAYAPDAFATLPVTQRLAFNKIRNAGNDIGDYIELKNISETAVRLRNWTISSITSDGANPDEDVGIVWFPDYTLPGGGVLLITNTEPDETVLVDGLNITPGAHPEPGAQHPYLVAPPLKLPSTPYLLILRHALGKNGTSEAIEDMVGDYFQSVENTADWLETHIPHPSAPVAPLSEAGTWQRTDTRQPGYLATAWTVSASPPGLSDTPTAPDGTDAHFAPDADAAAVFNPTLPDEVRITELMYETEGPSGPLPEWIELYNASATPVDLQSWQLRLENRIENTHQDATLTLKPIEIPAKQTVLLVNGKGRRAGALPPHRIYDLSEAYAAAFGQRRLKNTLISRDGFFLQLIHPTGRIVDTCGTLDGDPRTDDLPTWTLPDSKTRQGHRFSLLRRFDADVRKGTEASGWMPATAVAIATNAYYGHPTDISTPGFLHQIVPGVSPTVALSISEIMFTTQTPKRDGLPQWIELYNPSFTGPVNLKDFQLVVETRHAGDAQQIVMTLEAFDVLPNQTVVLITARGRHSRHFAENRTYNLSQRHPKTFAFLPNRSHLLSREAFLIQLADATGNVVDTVGNLDGYPFTEDTPAWTLPEGETPDGARASIRRLYEKRRPLDGRHREAWVSTATVPPVIMTYGYGDASDVGNPGYRMGGPLPVVLSSFGARRNADDVVVSWTTESSLENAGFHLYRSTQRKSGFVRVNPRLIQGAGTTAEKQTYTYVDNPPKADGVYYYQIQEVSFSGQQQVLATARMKGYLSADGKHLTTLGALKTGGGVKDK